VHLVGFIIRIYHDVRSPERQKILKFRCLCFNNISMMIIFERSKHIAALLTYTHTHTHTHIYIYIYLCLAV
jgi:hypothetical protein